MSIKNDVTGKQVWDGIRMLKGTGFKVVSVIKYDKNGVRNVVGYLPGKACIVQVRVSEDKYSLLLDGQLSQSSVEAKTNESTYNLTATPMKGHLSVVPGYNGKNSGEKECGKFGFQVDLNFEVLQEYLSQFYANHLEEMDKSFRCECLVAYFVRNYNCVRDGAFSKTVFTATNKQVLAKIPKELFIRKDGSKVRLITS